GAGPVAIGGRFMPGTAIAAGPERIRSTQPPAGGTQFSTRIKDMSDIKRIETGPRMSHAVVHGGLVYLAGQVGTAGASVTQQTKDVLAKIDRLLAEVGSDKSK